MKSIAKYYFIFLLLIATVLWGCPPRQPVCVKKGNIYCKAGGVFTYQWYDYYERALSCMEGECYSQALSDLNKALDERKKDQRMAKTYGMHLMDYFPHREKGLIYYLAGDDAAALKELEQSLSSEPSSKAQFYIDKIRKRTIKRKKESVSIPQLILPCTLAQDEIWTNADPIIISGQAEDKQYISEIILAGQPLLIKASKQQISFSKAFTLTQGKQEIDITVRNLLGGTAQKKLILYVDRSGPAIVLKHDSVMTGIQGCLYDESGEVELFVNGKKIPLSKGKTLEFLIPFPAKTRQIILLARDKLGNQTQAFIDPEMLSRIQHHPWLLAKNCSNILTDMSSSGSAYPKIILHHLTNQSPVFSDNISLEGQIISKILVKQVLINEKPIHQSSGHVIFFNHSIDLKPGVNKISILVKDSLNKEHKKDLQIIRKIPEVFKPEYRCTFKVKPFTICSFGPSKEIPEGILFQYFFLEQLVSKQRFQIKMQKILEDILQKQDFDLKKIGLHQTHSGSLNSNRLLLLGYIYKTKDGIEIVAKIVDIQDTRILNEEYIDAYGEYAESSVLKALAANLSEKFHTAFPLLKGKVTRQNGKKFFTQMEKGDIQSKWPLVVGSNTCFIGDAQIDEKLKDGNYWIKMLNPQTNNSIIGHWVLTQ